MSNRNFEFTELLIHNLSQIQMKNKKLLKIFENKIQNFDGLNFHKKIY